MANRFISLLVMVVTSSFRKHLQSGGKAYGSLLMSNAPPVAELMASVGYDFLIVDHEHSSTDVASGQALLQAIGSSRSTMPIVRVPSTRDPVYMKKVLDTLKLPAGILIPMVETTDDAKAVVASTRYPKQHFVPFEDDERVAKTQGIRGCAAPFVRATNWGLQSTDEYIRQVEDELFLMVQVESPDADIEGIASVDGVDMIFVGPMDLSCSIGKMGMFDDPEVKELLSSTEERIRQTSVLLGGFRLPGRDVREMFDTADYSLVCGSVDMGLIREAAKTDVEGAS